jgi:hypothetical protein
VLWLNSPKVGGKEVAYVRIAYGNESSLECRYSHATIKVTVPNVGERSVQGEVAEPNVSQG